MRKWADEVWVLTRANNQQVIEADPLSATPGLHFIYYDLPGWLLRLKKQQRWFLYIYCVLWQWGAYRLAAQFHTSEKFDRVYHVTFASMQFGSYMGRLGIPFIVGPVAGGERSPIRLRGGMRMRGKVSEMLRDLGILFQRYSPLTRPAFAAATRIYVTTPESLQLVPPKWRAKTSINLAIAAQGNSIEHLHRQMPPTPRFLFAGRLLHWKGVHLAIRALAEARRTVPNATITLVGEGPAETWLRALAKQCGIAEAVDFAGHFPREQLLNCFVDFTALIFPSLHDSGGLVVLEAFERGLPAICFDLGGPGIIVDRSCGIVVATGDADDNQTVAGLAKAIVTLATMGPAQIQNLSSGAIARANELSWTALAAKVANCEF